MHPQAGSDRTPRETAQPPLTQTVTPPPRPAFRIRPVRRQRKGVRVLWQRQGVRGQMSNSTTRRQQGGRRGGGGRGTARMVVARRQHQGGGVRLNLAAASRVVIFDTSWNPAIRVTRT